MNWPFEAEPAHFTAQLWESGELGDNPCGCVFWRVCQGRLDDDVRVSHSLARRSIHGLFSECEHSIADCVSLTDLESVAIEEMHARRNTMLRTAHFLIASCLAGCSRIRDILKRADLPLTGVIHELRGRTGRRWKREELIWSPLAPRISEYDLPEDVRGNEDVRRDLYTYGSMSIEVYQQAPLIQTALGYACGDAEKAREMIVRVLVNRARRSRSND